MPIICQPIALRISIVTFIIVFGSLKWDKISVYEIYCHLLKQNIMIMGHFESKSGNQNDKLDKIELLKIVSNFRLKFELFHFEIFHEVKETSLKRFEQIIF